MSDSQAYEEITVSSDGVTVVKRFEEDEFPVPAIAFEFESERDESVSVRLSDTVPEDIEVEDLGFHPEYGSEFWTIDEDTIVFERDFDANSTYTTVYGIRATGSDDVEQFLTQPTLESVDPPLPEDTDDIIPETDDDVVKDAISGDGEIPGLEEEDGEDDDIETLDLADPNDSGTAADDGDGGSDVEVSGDGVMAAMAEEIRQKNVSPEDVELLQRALNAVADGPTGSEGAKVAQLQKDIADLRAYTGAIEEFLDEEGTANEVIDDFGDRLDSFDQKLSSLANEVESNSSTVESVSSSVESMETEVDSMGDVVDSVSEEVESVSDEVDSVGDEVDSVSEEVDSVSDDVETVGEEVQSLSDEFDDVTDDVESVSSEVDTVSEGLAELETAVEDIESSVDDLEDQVSDGEVADRLEDIESEIEDLQTWQEQIKETFGG